MGLLSSLRRTYRRLVNKRVPSPKFAREVAKTTVRVVTDQQMMQPVLHKLQKEDAPASEEEIRREVAFLLHYMTQIAILKALWDAERGTAVFQQVTDNLVVHLNHEGLWPAERGPELERVYYIRKEEFIQKWEDSNTVLMDDVFFNLAQVTNAALFRDQEDTGVESQMELMNLAQGFYKRIKKAVDQVWFDLEQEPVEWPEGDSQKR